MGVWIEITTGILIALIFPVTPCVGVWIEILILGMAVPVLRSLPAWECGLKLKELAAEAGKYGHSLRGSVD